ncbi:LacI family DNA-binding transcriptional regulator [Bacillus litorisediminis]|uniref:LacI family DNA-binding transcriptional regulator n=1 Tax=Bacillus litorisediminis TaxID=2922713 RepID=UPI001FAD9DA8|nr:LacI family DNA-binding transcriptional regulator [Bacillus litorisediminis]
MKSKITIRDVAKEAGVSVATVSRYLNNNGYISDQAEKKIKDVMDRLNYQPNEIARGLAMKKTRTIALIIPDITNPFFPELVVAIEKVAKSKGYSIILVNTYDDDLQNNDFWVQLQNRYVDGFILASFQFDEKVLKGIEELQIPFVRIDRAADYNTDDSIGLNNFKGASLAVDHLIEVGCRNIAHISGPASYPPSQDRMRGYLDRLASRFPEKEPIVYEGDFSLESGKVLTEKLFQENPNVDGIFLANDLMAIGSLKALKLMGIQVPTQVALIGFDGIKLTEMVEPEISTVEQPIYEIGIIATNKLIHKIEGTNGLPDEKELDVRLVKRRSTLGFGV